MRRSLATLAAALAALTASAILSACGSSRTSALGVSGQYGPAGTPAALSRCLRANGLSDFPDLGQIGTGTPFDISLHGGARIQIDGRTFAGPVASTALHKCANELPSGNGAPSLSTAQRSRLLATAACLRRNGVPNFPDPTFSGHAVGFHIPPGVSPSSPAFVHAASVCGLDRGLGP